MLVPEISPSENVNKQLISNLPMHVNYVNKRTYSSVVVNIVVDNVVLGFLKLLLFFKQPGKSAFFRQSVLIRLHEILWSLVFLGELYICMNIYIYRHTLGPIPKKVYRTVVRATTQTRWPSLPQSPTFRS